MQTAASHNTKDKALDTSGSIPVAPLVGIAVVIALYFGALLAGQAAISVLPQLFGWSPTRIESWIADSAFAQFAYILVVEVITLGLLYAFLRSRKLGFDSLGLLQPRLKHIGVALAAYLPYFLLNAVALLSAAALFNFDTDQQQQIGFDSVTTNVDLLLTFISLVILPPLVEEIVMRGFLFGSLKNGLPVVRAAIVTSVIFAVAHLQFGSGAPLLWTAAIDTLILSLVLCYLRQRTGSLWPGIFLHALKNGLAFITLFIVPKL